MTKRGINYPCLLMIGTARSKACYACRMRNKTCQLDRNGPTEWISLQEHPCDVNQSSQDKAKYFKKWARRSDESRFSQKPIFPSQSRLTPIASPDDVPIALAATRSQSVTPPPAASSGFSSHSWIGGSEPMQFAMEIAAMYWAREARLPTTEEFKVVLAHCEREHARQRLLQSRLRSQLHAEPRAHAMEVMGRFFSEQNRMPHAEELQDIMRG